MKRDGFTMKTPAELAEQRENSKVWEENRRRERGWARLIRENAAQWVYLHSVDRNDPWADVHFMPCPDWCTDPEHRRAS